MAFELSMTYVTTYKEYRPESRIADAIKTALHNQYLNTYNHQYVIKVTVDRVDESTSENDDE